MCFACTVAQNVPRPPANNPRGCHNCRIPTQMPGHRTVGAYCGMFGQHIIAYIQMFTCKSKNKRMSLPCPQVSRAGWPIIYRQDVKVLLQGEALKHQLYPVVLSRHNHPRAVGIVRVTVRVARALYRPVGTV